MSSVPKLRLFLVFQIQCQTKSLLRKIRQSNNQKRKELSFAKLSYENKCVPKDSKLLVLF